VGGVNVEAVGKPCLELWDCDSDGIRIVASIWQAELLRKLITTAILADRGTASSDELQAWQELLDHCGELTWSTPADVSLVFTGMTDPEARTDVLRRLAARRGRLVPASLNYLADPLPPRWARIATDAITEDQRRGGRPVIVKPIVEDISDRRAQSQHVLGLLDAVWPELALERHLLVREVVFVTGDTGFSSTVPSALGAVFLAQPESDIDLYLSWIHEVSHHALHVRMAFDNLLENGQDRALTALRPDPRLLVGHFHQVFVIARMCQGIQRLLPHLNVTDAALTRQRLEIRINQFGLSLKALRKHAVFTAIGQQLADDLEHYYKQLVEEGK
jgi:hypothetical protein